MIGSKIQELRHKKGISLSELALKSGVSKSYLSSIERDIKSNPSIEVLLKISSVLDVNPYEIISSEDELLIDKEWYQIMGKLKISDIEDERLKDIKEYIEFIKWRSEKRKFEDPK